MGQGDSVSVLTQAKVWKMRKYWMYFPFFILHDWGKRSTEARSSHLSGVALNYSTSSNKHTAWQDIPSPVPVKPSFSSVVAFTFTRSGLTFTAAAIFSCI